MLALNLEFKSWPSFLRTNLLFFFITRKLYIGKQYNSLKLSFDPNINMYKVAKEQRKDPSGWRILIRSPQWVKFIFQLRTGTRSYKSPHSGPSEGNCRVLLILQKFL